MCCFVLHSSLLPVSLVHLLRDWPFCVSKCTRIEIVTRVFYTRADQIFADKDPHATREIYKQKTQPEGAFPSDKIL